MASDAPQVAPQLSCAGARSLRVRAGSGTCAAGRVRQACTSERSIRARVTSSTPSGWARNTSATCAARPLERGRRGWLLMAASVLMGARRAAFGFEALAGGDQPAVQRRDAGAGQARDLGEGVALDVMQQEDH